MTTTKKSKVVHCRKARFDAYIGRAFREFQGTRYGNPFHLGKDGNRYDVIVKFANYWYAPEQKKLREHAVNYLTGQILGCWCAPELCHGDIIAGYVNWKANIEE